MIEPQPVVASGASEALQHDAHAGLQHDAHAGQYNVCRAADITDGERRVFVVGGRSIGVFNVGGRFYALRNRCPHQGGPLCEGRLFARLESDRPGRYRYYDDRHLLECPWHGWEFDLATGQSWFDPARTKVRRYPVSVARARRTAEPVATEPDPRPNEHPSLQPGPYRADSYPVTVEEDCVIVDLAGQL